MCNGHKGATVSQWQALLGPPLNDMINRSLLLLFFLLLSLAEADVRLLSEDLIYRLLLGGAREQAKRALLELFDVNPAMHADITWVDTELDVNMTGEAARALQGRRLELKLRQNLIARQRTGRRFQGRVRVGGIDGTFLVSSHKFTHRSIYKPLEDRFRHDGDPSIYSWIMICREEVEPVPEVTPVCGLLGILRSPIQFAAAPSR